MTLKNYPPIICNRCNESRDSLVKCDRTNCDFEEYRNAVIARFRTGPPPKYYCSLTGGVNAGKTYFLISLLQDILNDEATQNQLYKYGINKIKIIDPISRRYFKRFKAEANSPDGLTLTVPNKLSFFSLFITTNDRKTVELVLFNTSGEKIEDEVDSENVYTKAHELKGAAILHFVDPREDSKLNDLLDNPKDFSFGMCKDHDIVNFLHQLFQVVNRGPTIINNPLAVCISKFDLLLPRVPFDIPEYPFVKISSPFFFNDIEASSNSLINFLYQNSTTIKPKKLDSTFNNFKYFAVAPYGSDKFPATWRERNSIGILAPFLWLLNELEILPNKY